MDRLMSFFAGISKEKYPNADMNKPGSGAAGGGTGLCFFPIIREVCSLSEAMDKETAAKNMTAAAEQVFRLILSFREE